jgi:hypothetical protein
VRIYVFKAKRQSLSGTAGSQSLKLSSKPEKVWLRVEGYIDSKKIELMVLKVFRFVYWAGNKTFCFSYWNGTESLRLAVGPKRCMSKLYENSSFKFYGFV